MKKLLILLTLIAVSGTSIAATKHKKHKHYKHHRTTATTRTARVTSTVASRTVATVDRKKQVPGTLAEYDKIDAQSVRHQPKLYSYSALAIKVGSGKILVSKNPDTQLPIASITKLMTAMVTLDSGADLDQYITISAAYKDQ